MSKKTQNTKGTVSEVKDKLEGYLKNIHKPLFKLNETDLREILDIRWYPDARDALTEQRKIWDYAYLAYKGIMLNAEINRKRRANAFGMYVNVPRTYMTIEGIRRNINISKLRVYLDPIPGMENKKRKAISSFLNYDMKRGKTFEQVKDAAFYKLLYGNGFLYSHLVERKGRFGKITGDIDPNTAIVKNTLDRKNTLKYLGMVATAKSPYKIFPDPSGNTQDYDDNQNKPVLYTCIRDVKHIATFRKDWRGIIPDEILNAVEPGGMDMTNYEAVKDVVDDLFSYNSYLRYPGTTEDYSNKIKSKTLFNKTEYVEERIWLGEDFFIVQAGLGLKFCIISPNPNPRKKSNLTKLDDIRMPDEYWSMGEAYIQRYQQIEENRLHNSVLDTVHFAISGMLGINTQYLEDEFDTEIFPQKVWKFKPIPGVKMDEMMQSFQTSSSGISSAMKFMEEVKSIGQSTTSITDFVTGASKAITKTATESKKLSGASDLAIADKIKEMAGGALTKVAKIFLSMYPVVYIDESFNLVFDKQKIRFIGQTKDKIPQSKLAKIIKKHGGVEGLVFVDELDINEPEFTVIGDVTSNRESKLGQWIAAIDLGNGVNQTAFDTGDPRRIDTIKMSLLALENFEVIGNPDDFLIEGQPTKLTEQAISANKQGEGGGAPNKRKITQPQTADNKMRQESQPNNRGKNRNSKKNL